MDKVQKPSDSELYAPSLESFKFYLKKLLLVKFEVFMAVTMKNGFFWDVTPCGSCKNRRFGGTGSVSILR
jgi:hypothetical protein